LKYRLTSNGSYDKIEKVNRFLGIGRYETTRRSPTFLLNPPALPRVFIPSIGRA
jgi:hypothetical protein